MTDHTTDPTTRDIYAAIQQFGEVYHDLHVSVDALRDELRRHDANSSRDRAGLHEQLDGLQRSMDRRFDAFGRELDQHTTRLDTLESLRTELLTRLQDVEARLGQIEDTSLTALIDRIARLEARILEQDDDGDAA